MTATGRFPENVMQFVRLLRRAGLPIGTGQTLEATRAVAAVGVDRRDDVYWALHAVCVRSQAESVVFDEAFRRFFRDPFGAADALSLLLPSSKMPEKRRPRDAARRLHEAMAEARRAAEAGAAAAEKPPEREFDMTLTFSSVEVSRTRDFAQMSAEELLRARRVIARMRLPVPDAPTRRFGPAGSGQRIDLGRTLRKSLRGGAGSIDLAWRAPVRRAPPLVAICDISGSMERYSRMFLHFLHALVNQRPRVHAFVFGTRLTNVTRSLRHRDPDAALARVGQGVSDWSGGTRIASALHAFNERWGRRVLGHNAVVLLVTDGLDRDPDCGLEAQAVRLRRTARRVIWLNPLLRYEGFEPKAAGVRALLPHVDMMRPVHDLASLEALVDALA